MFGQPATENLNRSVVIYDTTDKKNLHLRLRSLSWSDTSSSFYRPHIVFSTNWTSVMDHLQLFVKNGGTNEDRLDLHTRS